MFKRSLWLLCEQTVGGKNGHWEASEEVREYQEGQTGVIAAEREKLIEFGIHSVGRAPGQTIGSGVGWILLTHAFKN